MAIYECNVAQYKEIDMTAWIISIVGVVVLGVLVEIILPEGETAKYIKGIFGIIVVFVIVAPLPKLFGKELNIDYGANDKIIVEDNEYILKVNTARKLGDENNIKVLCERLDLDIEKACIDAKLDNYQIDSVDIWLNKSATTDLLMVVKKQIMARYGAKEINFYEPE